MAKKVQILKSAGCPSCAKASEIIRKIKGEGKLGFRLQELDIAEHPELVQKYQLMGTPGILIDGKLAFVGNPGEKKLRKALTL